MRGHGARGRRRALPLGVGALATSLALLGAVTGCGDRDASYCRVVGDHQHDLAAALDAGAGTGFLTALPILRQLQAKSPEDVRGDWNLVVGDVAALQQSLQAAGVDPSTYDAAHPPSGVTAAARAKISAAATALGSTATLASWQRVQQEVRDVCHTPLYVVG